MTTAKLAAALIRVLEGVKLISYWDPTGKVWTIGFGHTANVVSGMACTYEQAEQWLQEDMAPLFALVAGKPVIEAAALVSFGYNCGKHALERMLKGEISPGNYGRMSGGQVMPGLLARRNLEAALMEASRDSHHA